MITKSIKSKIQNYFFSHPTSKLRVRQIERQAKVALPSAIRYTKELEMEGILKSIIIADIKLYTADRTSKNFLIEKKTHNIKTILKSGIIESIITKYDNPTIILFGSYCRGEDIERSDIDIYIETPSNKKIDLKLFEKKMDRNIQLFLHKNIKSIKNKNLANNIVNGVGLNGFIEVFK